MHVCAHSAFGSVYLIVYEHVGANHMKWWCPVPQCGRLPWLPYQSYTQVRRLTAYSSAILRLLSRAALHTMSSSWCTAASDAAISCSFSLRHCTEYKPAGRKQASRHAHL